MTRPLVNGNGALGETGRRLPLDGAYNFRDIGGYAASEGRVVRWGRVFRSDHLGLLSDQDLEVLSDLGIRTVCDLRKQGERDAVPDRFGPDQGVEVLHLPIGGDAAQRYAFTARILAGEIRSFTLDEVIDIYERILREFPASIGAVANVAADLSRSPLLVHCTAGKDRTGLAVAVLLDVLGVSDDDIGDDYELTDRYHFDGRLRDMLPKLEAVGVEFADVAPFLTAPRGVILGTLERIRADCGSAERYLVDRAGVTPESIALLRTNLLT